MRSRDAELAADLDRIAAHFARHAAVERDAVRRAVDDRRSSFFQPSIVAMICCDPRLIGAGGSLGCSASRTPAFSASGTTAFRK